MIAAWAFVAMPYDFRISEYRGLTLVSLVAAAGCSSCCVCSGADTRLCAVLPVLCAGLLFLSCQQILYWNRRSERRFELNNRQGTMEAMLKTPPEEWLSFYLAHCTCQRDVNRVLNNWDHAKFPIRDVQSMVPSLNSPGRRGHT